MKACIPIIVCLLFSAVASAQDQKYAQPNTVQVGADGKFEARPDTAFVQFNVSAQESNSRAAYDRASKEVEQVRQILNSNGVDPRSAEIGYFAIEPVYDYHSPKRKLVGYMVNVSVSLKLKDFPKIGPITQQLSDSDITGNQSVSYTLEDKEAAKIKAVEDAYRRARASAEAVARASGRPLGELSSAAVDVTENLRVFPVMRALAQVKAEAPNPAPTEEFTPQPVSVTAHINAVFTLK